MEANYCSTFHGLVCVCSCLIKNNVTFSLPCLRLVIMRTRGALWEQSNKSIKINLLCPIAASQLLLQETHRKDIRTIALCGNWYSEKHVAPSDPARSI